MRRGGRRPARPKGGPSASEPRSVATRSAAEGRPQNKMLQIYLSRSGIPVATSICFLTILSSLPSRWER